MRIPHTIPRNVFETYRCTNETSRLPVEADRILCAEDVSWDEKIVPDLKTLALHAIVSTWQDNPIFDELPTCIDKTVFLEILPTNLPFELVITRITDEHYWERSAKDRWEFNNPEEHGNSWRRLYCERHLSEYLENLEPSYFESQQEDCENVIKLVRDYVYNIQLRSLRPTRKLTNWLKSEDEDPCATEVDIVHHIPTPLIFPKFPHLEEIHINFGMIYMDSGFEWRDFEFSVEDCINLGKAIKDCAQLQKFRLTRSNLDQRRVAAILQGIVHNNNIEELDFSHCKLGDTGAQAIGEFLSMHQNLKTLNLTNNNIGPNGIAGIVYGLLKRKTSILKDLDVSMNPLENEGANHVCAFLLRTDSLHTLNISGCGLTDEGGTSINEVLGSDCMKLQTLCLDLSNNNFGPAVGKLFETGIKACPHIIHCDLRMCNFSKESEQSIQKTILRNRKKREKSMKMASNGRNSGQISFSQKSLTHQLGTASATDWRRGASNMSDETHIDDRDLQAMKSILKFRNDESLSRQEIKMNKLAGTSTTLFASMQRDKSTDPYTGTSGT